MTSGITPTGAAVHTLKVAGNQALCREHYRLTLATTAFPPPKPGQFIHIGQHLGSSAPDSQLAVAASATAVTSGPFLRRAFSIGGYRQQQGRCEIDLIYRVVGRGTAWMSRLRETDLVDAIGPLGNSFPEPVTSGTAWLVAGGVGLPPLLWFAERLERARYQTVFFLGARSADLFPVRLGEAGGQRVIEEILQTAAVLATDDGSVGHHGNVVEALEAHIDGQVLSGAQVTVYTCGPEVMMRAVARLCATWQLPCYACTERAMACGIGTCQSCVVPVREPADPEGWKYALCCTEGPVFDATEILWDR